MGLLQDASLIVTPNAYKAGKLYSVVPSDGTGDFTVTRATSATRVNSLGLIEIPVTNLFTRSEEFETSSWVKTNLSVIENTQNSPINNLTADTIRILVDTVLTRHRLVQQLPFTNNTTYTTSYYLKKANHRWIQLVYVSGDFGIDSWANFDLENGVIGNTGPGAIATITNVGNGWYRCTLRGTTTVGGNLTGCEILTTNNTNSGRYPAYQSLVAEDVCYVWGAQLEQNVSATEYISTTSVVRTRFAGITQDGSIASNIPRLDYTNASCPSILVEPQRTNLITYSEDFDNVSWTKANSSIVGNSTISPSGLINADTFVANGVNSAHSVYVNPTSLLIANTTYTITIYAKKNTNNFIQIAPSSTIFNGYANFDLNSGTVALVSFGSTATITALNNGWYKCSLTTTTPATINTGFLFFNVITSGTAIRSESNTLTTSVFIWGAQLEIGGNATSYIPTTTAAVTRNADMISRDNIYTNGLVTNAGGTLFIEIENNLALLRSSANPGIFIGDSTGQINAFRIRNNANFPETIGIDKIIGGTRTGLLATPVGGVKIAITWNGTTANIFINSIKGVTNTAFPFVNMEFLNLNGTDVNKFIKSMMLFPKPLTDSECISLTTL